jgi:hypothetical protein
MVNSGTGHDRCPSVFPEPIRRPGATLRWRLRNYKSRFWFQGGVKIFSIRLTVGCGRPQGLEIVSSQRWRRYVFVWRSPCSLI